MAVSGRPSGRPATNHSYPEKISGDNIIGVRSVPPYPRASLYGDPLSETRNGPCVLFWGRSDLMSWDDRGFNDTLVVPQKGGWTHLTVLKADVLRIWPFGSAVLSDAPNAEAAQLPAPVNGLTARKPGPASRKRLNAVDAMRQAIRVGQITPDQLAHMLEKILLDRFGVPVGYQKPFHRLRRSENRVV